MNIYIASAFTERFWCRVVDTVLEERGWIVTSHWYHENNQTEEYWAEQCQKDIVAADTLLLFVAGQSEGGRWTEMGIAIAREIPVIIVGETRNIFQHLPNVQVCSEYRWLSEVDLIWRKP